MKKILFIIMSFVVFTSCSNLEDLNTNVKDFAAVKGEALFSNGQKNVVDQVVGLNVNYNIFRFFTQQWTETTYLDEANYDVVSRTIPGAQWNSLYRLGLKNLTEAATVLAATPLGTELPAVRQNKLATIEITKIYTWSVLVQTFGNIPYTEALDITKPTPKYDDAATIYKDLISRLNVAIGQLDVASDGMGSYDNIYHGDVAKLKMFANSLKLRMGVVIADYDAALSKTTVESAVTSGVILDNADNAAMAYMSDQPNTNPIYVELVASGRHDFIPANTFVDAMNALNDPRRQFYMTTVSGSYVGGVYGFPNVAYASFSHVADRIAAPSFEGTILDAAETEFLLAEASARGFAVGGTAQSHYNSGITASILYWGGKQADVDAYLLNPKVDYANAASGATWKAKIGTQAWIALYNRGWEAWQEWVRLDYPVFVAPSTAKSAIPVRLIYPISEQTLNKDSYTTGAAAIGGDLVTTKLFFDKN